MRTAVLFPLDQSPLPSAFINTTWLENGVEVEEVGTRQTALGKLMYTAELYSYTVVEHPIMYFMNWFDKFSLLITVSKSHVLMVAALHVLIRRCQNE